MPNGPENRACTGGSSRRLLDHARPCSAPRWMILRATVQPMNSPSLSFRKSSKALSARSVSALMPPQKMGKRSVSRGCVGFPKPVQSRTCVVVQTSWIAPDSDSQSANNFVMRIKKAERRLALRFQRYLKIKFLCLLATQTKQTEQAAENKNHARGFRNDEQIRTATSSVSPSTRRIK